MKGQKRFDFLDTDRYLSEVKDPIKTRNRILGAASILFNTKGYKATSISDITTMAGITKGAVYKHFRDKSELEKECLSTMTGRVLGDITKRIKNAPDAKGKLMSILDYFEGYAEQPPYRGGCPLMNAATEVDDTNPELKKIVADIMTGITGGIAQVIQNGVDRGQLDDQLNANVYANLIYTSIEGGTMMMKVTDNADHLRLVVNYLRADIESKSS